MKSREEIFDIYVQSFGGYKTLKQLTNPDYIATESDINESLNRTYQTYSDVHDGFELSEIERKYVVNKIKSVYAIFQEEGCAILGDYTHDYKWYEDLLADEDFEQYYWDRYKNYLTVQKNFAPSIVDVLENKTLKSVMSFLGNPHESDTTFSVRGLVVGDVQSGKTSNYLGLLAKAADAGYKVIFILTGTIESLRRQTQERVEEGFIGYDSVNGTDVGVGRGDKLPKAFTSREKDFVNTDNQNTTYKISNYSSEPMIFVLKKNVSVLKKLYASLKNINTSAAHPLIDYPILLIDDEADNASINTHKADEDPTKINGYIRDILSLFTRSSYVGFTATPFANVFISYDDKDDMQKDDLFPRDFIYALNAPSNYCGSRKYFFEDNDNVRFIEDYDENIFPMKHKKDWDGNTLFDSVYHAVNTFLIVNAIRDIRDINRNSHRSMLINMSRFTNVQFVIKDIVEGYFDKTKKAVKQCCKLDGEYALTNEYVKALKNTFDLEYSNIIHNGSYITWDDVFHQLYSSISDIKIVVVNSSKKSQKLNYEENKKDGLRVIAIGGLALSRGLTLEGLCVSYFYRNTATFDVLMQMGRWFGYREGYADLCKIFITHESAAYYKEICQSIECLKDDIRTMCAQKKKPIEFGIRVLNDSIDLGITAANKMRNTTNKTVRKSFYGNVFETPYLHRDLQIIAHNIESVERLLSKISITQRDSKYSKHPYFRNISKADMVEFLKDINVHAANENFDVKQLLKFLSDRNDSELNQFDLLILGGESSKAYCNNRLAINIPMISRQFDIKDDNHEIIRMNRQRARLGGRQDTKSGLSESQLKGLNDTAREQDYMVPGRNPLLMIYFVDPNNSKLSNDEAYTSAGTSSEEKKLCDELQNSQYSYLVGFAIGFPQKFGTDANVNTYTVNKSVNYFEKDHEEYLGDDENE